MTHLVQGFGQIYSLGTMQSLSRVIRWQGNLGRIGKSEKGEFSNGDGKKHLEHNDLNDIYQSAFRRGLSTDTALLKVHSDIAEALDEGSMTALIMLDLSAAFDVIDHLILLNPLELSFEINTVSCIPEMNLRANC